MTLDDKTSIWQQIVPIISRGTAGTAVALISLATIATVWQQVGAAGLTSAILALLSSLFGDVIAGPAIEPLLSGMLSDEETKDIVAKFEAQLEENNNDVRQDIANLVSQQNSFIDALGYALKWHENSTVNRILQATARYQEFGIERVIKEFRQLYHEDLRKLDPEIQYLVDLIANLEKTFQAYIDLPVRTDEIQRKPKSITDAWNLPRVFSLLEEDDQFQESSPFNKPKTVNFSQIFEVLSIHPRFVLIGEPGSGKTTTIQHLALETAKKRLQAPKDNPIPMLLLLPSWQDENIESFIRRHWNLIPDPIGMMSRGEISLYLDGLNELGANSPSKAGQLYEWLLTDRSPQQIIVTCRTADYMTDLGLGIPTVTIEELSEPLIVEYVNQYIGEEAGEFLNQLSIKQESWDNDRNLLPLAKTPLLLMALIVLYKNASAKSLPHNSGMLFQSLINFLWERERQKSTKGWVAFSEMQKRVSNLAFGMIQSDLPTTVPVDYMREHLPDGEFLDALQSAKLVEIQGGEFRFYHQLIQEYFAAIKLHEVGVSSLDFETRFDYDGRLSSKWDQVIICLSGILSPDDAFFLDLLETDPWLLMLCIDNGVKVHPDIQSKLAPRFIRELDNIYQEWRLASVLELGKLKSEEAIPFLLADLYQETGQNVGAISWALGQIGSAAIFNLLEALDAEETHVRITAIEALGYIGDPDTVLDLVQHIDDPDSEVREVVAKALGDIGDPNAISALLTARYDVASEVRWHVIKALGKVGDETCTGPLVTMMQSDYWLCGAAAEALGKIGDSRAVPYLIDQLANTDEAELGNELRVCDVAARSLRKIGTPEALDALQK